MPVVQGDDVRDLMEGEYATGCQENGYSEEHARTERILHAMADGWNPNGYGDATFSWLVRFTDGTFAYVAGWHDNTGWDCQSGLEFHMATTYEEAMRLAPETERRLWEDEAVEHDRRLRDEGQIR